MKKFYGHVMLFVYSCLLSILMLLLLGGLISAYYFLKGGGFYFPMNQLKRAIIFGCVAGTAITLATMVSNATDKFKARKKTSSDPE